MPARPYTIRKATAADASGILGCLSAAFADYRAGYTPGAYADTVMTPESIHERLRSNCVFVAIGETWEIAGTIGCSLITAEEGHLRGMAVLPEWHGSGVAAGLLDAAESELRARGCKRVTLDTTKPLQRATRFYEKHGYRPTGKVDNFFGMALYEYAKQI